MSHNALNWTDSDLNLRFTLIPLVYSPYLKSWHHCTSYVSFLSQKWICSFKAVKILKLTFLLLSMDNNREINKQEEGEMWYLAFVCHFCQYQPSHHWFQHSASLCIYRTSFTVPQQQLVELTLQGCKPGIHRAPPLSCWVANSNFFPLFPQH